MSITSPFPTVGLMLEEISIFDMGIFLPLLALCFGLARATTKNSKQLPIFFGMYSAFFSIVTIIGKFPLTGTLLAVTTCISTMIWFIPIWRKTTEKKDLMEE